VKRWYVPLVTFATLSASIALTGDFKTINGKEYKNATVSRVEPDGIVLKSKPGITKVYFAELPKDVQEQFHHGSAQGAHFTSYRERRQSKMERSYSIVSAQPLINSLPSMECHKIRLVSTRTFLF